MLSVSPAGPSGAVQTRGWRWQIADTQLLGPCAFYAAFGRPGPRIASWLSRSAYAPASIADFTGETPPADLAAMFGEALPPWRLAVLPLLYGPWAFPLPRLFPCAAGDADACERVVLRDTVDASAYRLGPRGSTTIIRAPVFFAEGTRTRARMLSDLVHERGAAAFGRFWASPAPVDSAFREAYHESLGSWASAWAARVYGDIIMSSRLRLDDFLASGVAVALALGAAVGLSFRRQVG
jgi:hypothetical protein